MIHYQLQCDSAHAFDGWFKDSASFDRQAISGLVACPICNSGKIRRALMAPSLGRANRKVRERDASELSSHVRPTATSPDLTPPVAQSPPGTTVVPRTQDRLRSLLQQLRSEVEKHCDYVGLGFADEARRIHYGEADARGIYGETTPAEAEALVDEGIEFRVLPWARRADS